jgi:hypothetical protein
MKPFGDPAGGFIIPKKPKFGDTKFGGKGRKCKFIFLFLTAWISLPAVSNFSGKEC